jgi:hypothetical protein
MSKDLQEVVDSCSDWLITALDQNYSDKGLVTVLKTIDKIQKEIDRGVYQ